ncbi:butyrophilin subfamily 1 member A1-like isoform X2 [Megalops cyprinoides]|uniref:butyrophilin subfamily 1 member A1-like isoform X2 n=1 Tax=Megalops cyprinoides TaxID=118141 RepID=UPI001864DF69|nr:butyrophilin subfamily 1 member A1-like isoform X2 [Megalops cyprinoides]
MVCHRNQRIANTEVINNLFSNIKLQTSQMVRGTLNEKVTLPCRIIDGRSAAPLNIIWTKDRGTLVYTYQAGKGHVGAGFEGRVKLDERQLDSGDVNLVFSNSSLQDEGSYICQVETTSASMELRLGRVGSSPQLLVDSFESSCLLSISCLSNGWYPNPLVSWTSSSGQVLTGTSLDMKEKGHSTLVDIRNRVTLTAQEGLKVTCTLLNPVLQTQTQETLTITGVFPLDVSPWLIAFWVVLLLVVMAAGIIVYFFKCKMDFIKEKEKKAREAEREPLMKQSETDNKGEYEELKKELSKARVVNNSEWKRILSKKNDTVSLTAGREGLELSSGNHYWEVTLKDKNEWRVGVKKKGVILGKDASNETGVWALSCHWDTGYRALLRPPFPITPSSQPEKLGILLDYTEGQLTLYDLSGRPVHRLYTFDAMFDSPVVPFYD